MLPSDPIQKYFGVTLERHLNYRKYLELCVNKIPKRNCILRELAKNNMGHLTICSAIVNLALCCMQLTVALLCGPEAGAPNWFDVKLRESMRTIAVCAVEPDPKLNLEGGWVSFVQGTPDDFVDIAVYLLFSGSHATNGTNLQYGVHIHQYGDISNGCGSTGGLFNPYGLSHGGPYTRGRLVGDLGNFKQQGGGVVYGTRSDDVVSLYGAYSVIGRSIVVYERVDDLGVPGDKGSLTTGNAELPIACCVIGLGTSSP
ncbi:superoxide dismutase [Cu-Zn] [Elysia marginata]|uniref:Superoxide dismutase [Cu-Zn] n=1 Tax=Elysia marginata TaxID=1093978 RepID=A0AAV4IGR1_9GAST|nr:superoxide dismutase [Cu-Zn] [Elysia marginata]